MTSSLARLAEALPDTRPGLGRSFSEGGAGGSPGGPGGPPPGPGGGPPPRHQHSSPPGAQLGRAASLGSSPSPGGGGSPAGLVREHRLQSEWAFHYMRRQGTGQRTESYEQSIKMLGQPFNSVEGFWAHYSWIKRPSGEEHERMPPSTDLHIFRSGVKPMWEDPGNRLGGKFVVRVRKGLAARYWEDLCCAIVGEQFGVGDEVCGAVLSLRFQEDIISLWSRTAANMEANERIRSVLGRVLNLDPAAIGDYKPHNQSRGGPRSTQFGSPDQGGGLMDRMGSGGAPPGPGGMRGQGPPVPPGGGRAPF